MSIAPLSDRAATVRSASGSVPTSISTSPLSLSASTAYRPPSSGSRTVIEPLSVWARTEPGASVNVRWIRPLSVSVTTAAPPRPRRLDRTIVGLDRHVAVQSGGLHAPVVGLDTDIDLRWDGHDEADRAVIPPPLIALAGDDEPVVVDLDL